MGVLKSWEKAFFVSVPAKMLDASIVWEQPRQGLEGGLYSKHVCVDKHHINLAYRAFAETDTERRLILQFFKCTWLDEAFRYRICQCARNVVTPLFCMALLIETAFS